MMCTTNVFLYNSMFQNNANFANRIKSDRIFMKSKICIFEIYSHFSALLLGSNNMLYKWLFLVYVKYTLEIYKDYRKPHLHGPIA